LVPLIIGITLLITGSLVYVQPLAMFFDFEPLSPSQLTMGVLIGFTSVIWYELVKWWTRKEALTMG
jgi:Ca2+-transporting ATPase